MIGAYRYEDGTEDIETSFFVPFNDTDLDKFIYDFKKLSSHFNQESFLLGLPQAYNYDGWEPKDDDLKAGDGHYIVFSDHAELIGKEAVMESFEKSSAGSVAVDDKDRILEWTIKGVTTPVTVKGCWAMDKAGLKWFRRPQKIDPTEFGDKRKAIQRALQKVIEK
jgi:hypothetical protein